MLSSTIPCPQCHQDSVLTLFGPNGPDLSQAEISFACPNGHDVAPRDLLAAWNAGRGLQAGVR